MQEIVISLMADVARDFLHDRHADLYFGLKRMTILVSATRPLNIYALIYSKIMTP
jgi:hypothetical protein